MAEATALIRPRRVLVIENPRAGPRRGTPPGEAAARAAAAAGAKVALSLTEAPGDAERLAREAASDGFDLVIAAGGDGTVHEAANGLAATGVVLGVAPAGTMNLLARVMGLPLDPARAVESLAGGYRARAVRPGRVDGRLFVLMFGCGFDAWVLREMLRGARGKIGFADYVRGAALGLGRYPFPSLAIDHDGAFLEAHTVIVGRAPLYGGFLRPTPHVELGADRLELCALAGGALRLAALMPRLWSGAHAGCDGVTLARVRRVAIGASGEDVPYQLDGELAGALPAEISISERILLLAEPQRRAG